MGISARAIALTGSDQQVRESGAIFKGYAVSETSASNPAAIAIHDGTDNTGTVLAIVSLTAGQTADLWLDGMGIWAAGGIFVDVLTGAVAGSVRVG